MNREEYLQFVFENGISFGESGSPYFIENYKDLDISSEIKNLIKVGLSSKLNFEIPVSQFPNLLLALKKQIRGLLKHQDFNPFKEELRNKNPEKYNSLPFNFEGKTYYLYTKGTESNIDSSIRFADSFIRLINDHQVESKPLKFSYK